MLLVAKELKICTTILKKICRKLSIKRWPYRQIKSLSKSIQTLEIAKLNNKLNPMEKLEFSYQIQYFKKSLDRLINDPSTPRKY